MKRMDLCNTIVMYMTRVYVIESSTTKMGEKSKLQVIFDLVMCRRVVPWPAYDDTITISIHVYIFTGTITCVKLSF